MSKKITQEEIDNLFEETKPYHLGIKIKSILNEVEDLLSSKQKVKK